MEIIGFGYIDGLKRYLRRRRYQRLDDSMRMKRKLKIVRLGSRKNSSNQNKLMKTNRSGFKLLTPLKLVARLHEAYIDAMVRLSSSKRIDHVNNEAKRAAKSRPIPMLSAPTNEMVDRRVVVEMYKRVVSSRDQNSALLVQEVH